MKKIVLILAFGMTLANCNHNNSTEYIINGNAENVYNGIRVHLDQIDEKGQKIPRDTAIVMEGKFKFKGSIDEPSLHILTVNGSNGNLVFMLENSNITIDFNKDAPMESKITGSKSNDSYKDFQEKISEFKEEGVAIMTKSASLKADLDIDKQNSLDKEIEDLKKRQAAFPLKFVQENNESYFSLNLIQIESGRPGFDILKYKEAFESFPEDIRESKRGQLVKQTLDELYEKYEKTVYLEIGKVAPNFESQTPDGKTVSLNELKGKVTIIDFWAAWCGPCRKENPNVVKVYEQYHDKGLEIIGVSLDGAPNQKDPKKAWLDAIEKDGLKWNHVSSLMYFNDPVAKQYNITSIPATYILDEEGKIVAKNLRGPALENKVGELLD